MSLKRIINFLNRYILKHPVYVFVYSVVYFFNGFSFKTHLYTKKEISNFIKNGKSIIRFGDGEINLLLDLKNHYHSFDKRLKIMMKEIVSSYSVNSPYILSVPRFIKVNNYDLKKIGKFNVWLPLKVVFFIMFPKNVGYMDAHSFYYDNFFEDTVFPFVKNKKVICITNKKTFEIQKQNKNFPWKNMLFVEAPSEEALRFINVIKDGIDKEIFCLSKKDILLIFAMGPVGKFLAYEYSKKEYQCIDIGVSLETIFTEKSIENTI